MYVLQEPMLEIKELWLAKLLEVPNLKVASDTVPIKWYEYVKTQGSILILLPGKNDEKESYLNTRLGLLSELPIITETKDKWVITLYY